MSYHYFSKCHCHISAIARYHYPCNIFSNRDLVQCQISENVFVCVQIKTLHFFKQRKNVFSKKAKINLLLEREHSKTTFTKNWKQLEKNVPAIFFLMIGKNCFIVHEKKSLPNDRKKDCIIDALFETASCIFHRRDSVTNVFGNKKDATHL